MIIRDKITYDAVSKKATIMRDGDYLYLAGELGMSGRDPYEPIRVHRPAEEVEKAHARFNELKRLPVTKDHPENFLDLSIEDSYVNGYGENPVLNKKDSITVLDCNMIMQGKALDEYTSGTKELSCGWEGDFEPVGEQGLGYEFIQRFRDINHIALVSSGRCGRVCSIMDKKTVKDYSPPKINGSLIKVDKEKAWELENKKELKVGMYWKEGSSYMVVLSDGSKYAFRTESELREWHGGATGKLVNKDSKVKDAKFKIEVRNKKTGEVVPKEENEKWSADAISKVKVEMAKKWGIHWSEVELINIDTLKDSKNKDVVMGMRMEIEQYLKQLLSQGENKARAIRLTQEHFNITGLVIRENDNTVVFYKKIGDSKNKDGGNQMLKDKIKSILDELGVNIEPEKEKEFGEKLDEVETGMSVEAGAGEPENKPVGEHLEMSMENLVRLLVFAGVEEETAKAKVGEFMQQSDCGIAKKDASVDVEKEKEKEDASVDVDKEKEKEDASVDKDKEDENEKVKDAAINDAFTKGKEAGRAEAVKRFTDVMPVIKSGDFKLADILGKTACEIKAMFVKKVLNEDIEVTDAALDRVYEIAIKSKKMDEVNVEPETTSQMVKEINEINNGGLK